MQTDVNSCGFFKCKLTEHRMKVIVSTVIELLITDHWSQVTKWMSVWLAEDGFALSGDQWKEVTLTIGELLSAGALRFT